MQDNTVTRILPRERECTREMKPPRMIGRYRIHRCIGQGGMGTVYLGSISGPGGLSRSFAIKTLRPKLSLDGIYMDMLLDEARIAGMLHHPNAVGVQEVGVDDGRYFLAMDYVAGEHLGRILESTGERGMRLPVACVLHLIATACDALHAAHELCDPEGRFLGVVHRDVSPQNLIVGCDGVLRVTDFGIAKALDQLSRTLPGYSKGKSSYMSPEQSALQLVDRRSDVFSLGVVLWEALTGERLFSSNNPLKTAELIRRQQIPAPSSIRRELSRRLDAIVMCALERDRDRRFPTARDFGCALLRHLWENAPLVTPAEIARLVHRPPVEAARS
jgi:serine/threonine-protein kinase